MNKKAVVKRLSEWGKLDAFAWGMALTSKGELVNVGTGLLEARQYDKPCRGIKLTSETEVSQVKKELRVASAVRGAPWPTVEKYFKCLLEYYQ